MAEPSVFLREVVAGGIVVREFLSVCSLCFCAVIEDIGNGDSPMAIFSRSMIQDMAVFSTFAASLKTFIHEN